MKRTTLRRTGAAGEGRAAGDTGDARAMTFGDGCAAIPTENATVHVIDSVLMPTA